MKRSRALFPALLLIAGCAVPEDAGFKDVQGQVETRIPQRIHWNRGTEEDDQVAKMVNDLFSRDLTPESAVQIALLNNPELQASYEDLGVAQADLVQAGLLENPTIMGSAHFPTRPGIQTGYEFEIVQVFLDLLMFPAKKELASLEFHRTKLRVADEVIELASRARAAWYEAVAARQIAEVRHAIAAAADASAELAKRLKAAGNISELTAAREKDLAETARIDWETAELEAAEAREKLTVILGAWGAQTAWTLPERLPDLPSEEVALDKLESLAIARRLDLAAALRESDSSRSRLEMVKNFRWLGIIELGFSAHREPEPEVGWLYGPSVALTLPVFDRQQAKIFALEAELRRRESLNRGLAVRIRSDVRLMRERLVSFRRQAEHLRTVVVPLRERIVALALKEYNFMLIGVADVLRAKEEEYDAYEDSIERVRDYWIARGELERAVGGRLPESEK